MKRRFLVTLALALAACLLGAINSPAAVHYVNVNGTKATPPYTNWATAATNIQQAVGAAAAGDEVVVTNGVYPGGLNVTNPLTLRSINGPQVTIINGGGPCVALTNGASLTGFTVTHGTGGGVRSTSTNAFVTNCVIVSNSVRSIGGGAFGVVLYNCTLSGNSANGYATGHPWPNPSPIYFPGLGGGAAGCLLYNCMLASNRASFYSRGGGAYASTLYNCTLAGNLSVYGGGAGGSTLGNCTLTGNSAQYGGGANASTLYNCALTGNSAATGVGGGAFGGTLNNCIVYSNTAADQANYSTNSVLNYCCTIPLATNGVGNITNDPLFLDLAAGNLRLQTNSPCINAGNNAYVTTATDLDGHPRIAGGIVDMGAFEFQPGVSGGQFSSAAYSPLNGFSFTFSGATVGQAYRIQTSSSPATGSWSDFTNFTYTEAIIITDPSAVAGPKKFYRAVSP